MMKYRLFGRRKNIFYKSLVAVLALLFLIGYVTIGRNNDESKTPPGNEPVISNIEIDFKNQLENQLKGEVIEKETHERNEYTEMQPNIIVKEIVLDRKSSIDDDLSVYDEEIREANSKVVPGLGEEGVAVELEGEEYVKAKKLMKKEAFNIVLSDKISLNRSVPDSRDPLCSSATYDNSLPSASIIIIFTNEAWSPLLRTVWSVLNRSPIEHIKEIILVDDCSDRKEMIGRLQRYVIKYLPSIVKLHRLKERHGLIRARLAGAKVATGEVMIFLDSHCEVNVKWLEPLLQRLTESTSAVLMPIIDVIDDKTLEYYHGNDKYFQIGGFTWSGHFTWIDIPEREVKRRNSQIGPTRSPTMAGGLFAINRNYFWEIGGYDPGMDVWGGENLEMSFRIWMCGGTLEAIPCSRVGHIFRDFHPYTFPGNKDTHGINTARMAEVWMDDYKRLFYMYRPELQNENIGEISGRMALRKKLQCQSFKWFLENVIPEKFILDENVKAYGRIKNSASSPYLCFDTRQNNEENQYNAGLYYCNSELSSSQVGRIMHSKN